MNFERIATGLNVTPLLSRIAEEPALWQEITTRQDFPGSAHHDTEAIYLRWCLGTDIESVFSDLDSIDYPAAFKLADTAQHVVDPLFKAIGEYEDVGRAMVVKLKPHGSIDPHVDEGKYADHYDRFHVCLSGTCDFTVNGKTFQSKPGEAWWFNHKLLHGVENRTIDDRVHLIVDVQAPKFRAKRGTTFQQEKARDLWTEITPLLNEHFSEIAHYQDLPLEPDVERYNAMDDQGLLQCFTARHNGSLVGYAIFLTGPNLHYSLSRLAIQDVLYVHPDYRNKRVGWKLLDHCENRLFDEGVQVIYQHEKAGHPELGRLLQARGYTHIDNIWGKRWAQPL